MRFENDDSAGGFDPADFGHEDSAIDMPADGYAASDLVRSYDEEAQPHYYETPAPRFELPVESVIVVSGRLTQGEHWNPQVQEAIERKVGQVQKFNNTLEEFFDSLPPLEIEPGSSRDRALQTLHQDFPERAPMLRALRLPPRKWTTYTNLTQSPGREPPAGFYRSNRIIIADDYVPDKLIRRDGDILFHEGFHGIATNERTIVVARPLNDGEAYDDFERATGYRVRGIPAHGLVTYDPQEKIDYPTGHFWEEAYTHWYTHHTRQEWEPFEGDGNRASAVFQPGKQGMRYGLRFSDNPDHRIYDRAGEYFTLPWQYASAVYKNRDEDGALKIGVHQYDYAAFTLNMLARRLPELLINLDTSRHETSIRREVIDDVNSVKPGLFSTLNHSRKDLGSVEKSFIQAMNALDGFKLRIGDVLDK